jgi:hypothetical protein
MPKRLESPVSVMILLGVAWACLAIGVAVGVASSDGSSSRSATESAVGSFDFRTDATSSRYELHNVLSKHGLVLKATCMRANSLPVAGLALSTRVPASFGIHYGLQSDETPTQIFHQISPGQVTDLLGPIGKGNGATGTLSYLPSDGDAVTVNFVAMTRAMGADCIVGGTFVGSSR